MARRRTSTIAFDAIAVEGSLITPDMLARIAALDGGEQSDGDYDTPPGLKLRLPDGSDTDIAPCAREGEPP
jgi:hypothetical protein